MLQSIRVRLTAWYAGALALFMTIFALGGYVFVARATGARIDEALRETAIDVARALQAERRAGTPSGVAILSVMREFRLGQASVAVLDYRSGTTVIAFELEPEPPERHDHATLPSPPDFGGVLRAAPSEPAFATIDAADAPLRVYTFPYQFGVRPLVVGAAHSLAARQRTLQEARTALAIGAPLMLLLATLGGYILARTSLHPVSSMAEQAARIGAGTLHERLPVGNTRDELGLLAAVFNELLGRLEAAFERQRRFMADASHELRTPLAIVGGEAELALARDDRSPEELRTSLDTIGQESARMRRIVEELLLLSRAGTGEQPLSRGPLYLADLVGDAARAVRTLAARRQIAVALEVKGDLPFIGDEQLLHRMVVNLLDNAIKYTPPGGRVAIAAERRGTEYVLEVADTGPGIRAEARERIFDRFFRVRGAGTEAGTTGGAGLGLAIVRWIAEAHDGRVALTRAVGGSTFTVSLPAPGDEGSAHSSAARPTAVAH